jgi:RNA polymerase sigma-70 factor (ECF subfamily)
MQDTPVSLLERLKQPAPHQAWTRFVNLYAPLLYRWVRRLGVSGDQAEDLVQEVFAVLVQALPAFTYDPQRGFHGWLWTVTLNKVRESKRRLRAAVKEGPEAALDDQAGSDTIAHFDEAEYRSYLMKRALQLMQHDFQECTWKAFLAQVIEGRPAPEVAAELNLSVGAVYAAKFRVLARLRSELAGLLD